MSDSASLASVLESQNALLQEASLALPHSFSQCTYSLGHLRQAVYLCLTCTPPNSEKFPRGICAACSVACHTDHDQLELFPKRNFRCDCPTSALDHACTLHTHLEEPNATNAYGRNFKAEFCRCGRAYHAESEQETMIQCVACEDWFHESCLNLRERPPSRAPTPEAEAPVDDGASEASSSGLPPPLIRASDYDALVCSACVRQIDALRKIAGTPGALMVVRPTDSPAEPWSIIGKDEVKESVSVDIEPTDGNATNEVTQQPAAGEKRERSWSVTEEHQAKKARVFPDVEFDPPCLAPVQDPRVRELLECLDLPSQKVEDVDATKVDRYHGAGDVFLTEGWRDRWCRCKACLPSLQDRSYLLEEEETYEPPEDPDLGLSLEELGMRALQRLPRESAINGIMAFNAMRDDLMKHLRPFAERGDEVTEADIRGFFDARIRELEARRR
ncbi:hypothetical protein L226DRAFT_479852 [Lentinus tigrinus ALCF2SS1-7]|uniref:UBR-type domain-containing protein n=1 Tax=Lentinus tigrinus ALCF2SS1-6 TaxID=1328759 RepID=A0A5C2SNV8_9APHY|nr:hypothetical protein L227DRAFT_570821 [Lentinus tigrinus ALCF2SS1-6]RPD79096.1 hypothetical protein L226DRAFT_479852 [Lentinus tigrinus ALCF2SS1-7]